MPKFGYYLHSLTLSFILLVSVLTLVITEQKKRIEFKKMQAKLIDNMRSWQVSFFLN